MIDFILAFLTLFLGGCVFFGAVLGLIYVLHVSFGVAGVLVGIWAVIAALVALGTISK